MVSLQRILTDLDEESAVQYGHRFRHLSDGDLGFRIEALVRQTKIEQSRSAEMFKSLEMRSTQYEHLERQHRKLNAAFEAKCEEIENHQCPINTERPKLITEPHPRPPLIPKAKPVSFPTAPPKFAGVRKSFQVPDGLGGTKKSLNTKFGKLDI